jgi:hypothetical protein
VGVRTDPRTGEHRNLDAAQRLADTIALHQTVLTREEIIAKRFIAVALSDGRTDGQTYDTRQDAMRHQRGHPALYAYIQVPLERWNTFSCDTLLWYVRGVYDAGYRPRLDEAELIIPRTIEEVEAYADAARLRHGP